MRFPGPDTLEIVVGSTGTLEVIFSGDNLLKLDGYLLLEVGGNNQQDAVESIFKKAGLKIEFLKDLQQDYRMVEVRR